jgi:hypothetical protein
MLPRFRLARLNWMTSNRPGCRRVPLGLVVAAGLALGLCASVAAQNPPAPALTLAASSRLPHPPRAEVWADAQGAPGFTSPGFAGPGIPAGPVQHVRVLVFQPAGSGTSGGVSGLDRDALVAISVAAGLIPSEATPAFDVLSTPRMGAAAAAGARVHKEQTSVYKMASPNETLVMGIVSSAISSGPFAYLVVLHGRINNVQSVAYAREVVGHLVQRRLQPALPGPPPGAVPAGPTVRLQGGGIRQLQQTIEQNSMLSARVKVLAQNLLPNASAVTLSTWRLPSTVSDQALAAYYRQQALAAGWGAPVVEDLSVPRHPTLLFQPAGGATASGTVMIRAQPAARAVRPVPLRPGTGSRPPAAGILISVLYIES